MIVSNVLQARMRLLSSRSEGRSLKRSLTIPVAPAGPCPPSHHTYLLHAKRLFFLNFRFARRSSPRSKLGKRRLSSGGSSGSRRRKTNTRTFWSVSSILIADTESRWSLVRFLQDEQARQSAKARPERPKLQKKPRPKSVRTVEIVSVSWVWLAN